MKMKKTFAGIIASIVAVSAMATSMVSAAADTEIKIDQVATTKTTAAVTLDLAIADSVEADNATGDVVIVWNEVTKAGAPADYAKFTSAAGTAKAKISYKNGLSTVTTDEISVAYAANATGVTLAAAQLWDGAAGYPITKIELSLVATKPSKFNATYCDLKLVTVDGLTCTSALKLTDDTTIEIGKVAPADGVFALLASEVKDAAVNGATAKLTFKATTADKTTVKVMSSQSRKEYTVDVAKGATTASIALPKEAFSTGVTNTLTFTTTGLTLTAATLAIAPAAVTTTAATTTAAPVVTTAAPAVTTAATTVPNASQPKTGSAAPVALAIIPVALAAAFVAKKKA